MNPKSAFSHRTERLYEHNEKNIYEFEASVISCEPYNDGLFTVELDRTAFFPEGGGQYSDTGRLISPISGEAAVSHVEISDGRIFHKVSVPFAEGETVTGQLDREKRIRRMQNHSGEHVISGLIHSLYGIENAGFHMTEGEVNEITIDTSAPLTADMLERVETLANKVVLSNKPIKCYFPDSAALESIEYRSKTELNGEIRLVEIEGVDICACCAPHVAMTGEIGPIHIKSFIKYKKGVRITAVCGEDALDYFRMTASAAVGVARLYSTRPEESLAAVMRREEYIKDKLAEIYSLRESLIDFKLRDLRASVTDPSASICIFEKNCDQSLMRKMVNEGIKLTRGCFAVFSSDGQTMRYTVGSSEHELSSLSARIRAELGGKGGGKGNMITGICDASEERIRAFFDSLSF